MEWRASPGNGARARAAGPRALRKGALAVWRLCSPRAATRRWAALEIAIQVLEFLGIPGISQGFS